MMQKKTYNDIGIVIQPFTFAVKNYFLALLSFTEGNAASAIYLEILTTTMPTVSAKALRSVSKAAAGAVDISEQCLQGVRLLNLHR